MSTPCGHSRAWSPPWRLCPLAPCATPWSSRVCPAVLDLSPVPEATGSGMQGSSCSWKDRAVCGKESSFSRIPLIWSTLCSQGFRRGFKPSAPSPLLSGLSGFWGRGSESTSANTVCPGAGTTGGSDRRMSREPSRPPCLVPTWPMSGARRSRPGGDTGPDRWTSVALSPALPCSQCRCPVTQPWVALSLPPCRPPQITTESHTLSELERVCEKEQLKPLLL